MSWVYDHSKYFNSLVRLYMSESDIYRDQILTYKDFLRVERVKTEIDVITTLRELIR